MPPAIEIVQQVGPEPSSKFLAERASREEPLPLSFAQKRLWVLEQLEPGNPADNISTAVCATGQLDSYILERSLSEIARRHETLRTVFISKDDQPAQLIAPASTFGLSISIIDLQSLPAHERGAQAWRLIREQTRRPFDLTQCPLMRADLFQLAQADSILCLTLHRMIADRWSTRVLLTELAAFYESFFTGRSTALPELPIQCADLAVWQQQLEQSDDWRLGHMACPEPLSGYWY